MRAQRIQARRGPYRDPGKAWAPRLNLTRFYGVFAPNSSLRSQVTPGGRAQHCRGDTVKTASERRSAMSWAERLKGVFRIDIESCRRFGGEG